MKKILGAGLAMAIALGLAGQVSAATSQSISNNAVVRVAAGEYDYPPFGSEHWWNLQEDRG